MNDSYSRWSTPISAMVILLLFALCAHQSLAQIEFRISGGTTGKSFVWQGDTDTFHMHDGKNYSFGDIAEILQVEKGGKKYFGETPYPWVKLGNIAWVFGPDGELRYCPTCAGTGNPGETPPWDSPTKIPWPETPPFIVQSGPVEDGVYVAKHDSTMRWYCQRLYYHGDVKSNWMECRK